MVDLLQLAFDRAPLAPMEEYSEGQVSQADHGKPAKPITLPNHIILILKALSDWLRFGRDTFVRFQVYLSIPMSKEMEVTPRKVLVVEDEQDIAELLRLHLVDANCEVTLAMDGHAGLREAFARHWDLVILDLRLPGPDGLSICRALRREQSYTPILMLTSKSSELDRVLGLELGADDYVTKPFSVSELMARVKAIFRRVESLGRQYQGGSDCVDAGPLEIDTTCREVRLNGTPVSLTAREFDLLLHFARHPGQVFSRAQLLDSVWGYGHEGYEHTVNSHINRLRSKIEADPSQPALIATVWGVGYKLALRPAAVPAAQEVHSSVARIHS
jgi:DNA-binding response OmpR family regulator